MSLPEVQRLETRGLRWRALTAGSGPPLLLLHGAGASADSFLNLIPLLANDWRILAPDLPGHGGTRSASPNRAGLASMAEDIAELVNAEFETPVAIISHSAGGAISLALDPILKPGSHVLINPALTPFDGAAGWLFPKLAQALAAAPFAANVLSRTIGTDQRIRSLLGSTGSQTSAEMVGLYMRLASDPHHIQGTLRMMAQWDISQLHTTFPELSGMVWMLLAENDRTVAPEHAELMSKKMPAAIVHRVSGGHLVHEESAELVASEINNALMPQTGRSHLVLDRRTNSRRSDPT